MATPSRALRSSSWQVFISSGASRRGRARHLLPPVRIRNRAELNQDAAISAAQNRARVSMVRHLFPVRIGVEHRFAVAREAEFLLDAQRRGVVGEGAAVDRVVRYRRKDMRNEARRQSYRARAAQRASGSPPNWRATR